MQKNDDLKKTIPVNADRKDLISQPIKMTDTQINTLKLMDAHLATVTDQAFLEDYLVLERGVGPLVTDYLAEHGLPYRKYASLIGTTLGLGKSEAANILGVSRTTLSAWIKGTSEPSEDDYPGRLCQLGWLLEMICQVSARPIYHQYIEAPLPDQNDSILTLLRAERWDLRQLQQLLTEALRLTLARDHRLGHDTPVRVSKAKQEINLLHNQHRLTCDCQK